MGNLGGGLSGAASGAATGSMFGPWGTAIGAGVGGLMGMFGGSGDTELEDLRTPEQIAAANALQQLGMTGSMDGLNLGEAYGGSFGNFQQSDASTQAMQGLQGLFGGQDISGARDVYSRMADNKFNPDDPSSGYAAFSRALAKSGQESSDVLNREAAITGSRFGTGIQQRKGDLAGDLANQRGMFLADLFNRGENRALQGAQGLQGLASQEQGLLQNMFSMGDFQRQLDTQKAQAQLQDFNRGRNEQMQRIGILQTEASRNPYMGISSLPGQNPMSGLIDSIGGAFGKKLGGSLFNGLEGLFS